MQGGSSPHPVGVRLIKHSPPSLHLSKPFLNVVRNDNRDKPIISHMATMGKHVSIILRDDLWHLVEKEKGLASRSAYLNHVIESYFKMRDRTPNESGN